MNINREQNLLRVNNMDYSCKGGDMGLANSFNKLEPYVRREIDLATTTYKCWEIILKTEKETEIVQSLKFND